MGERDRIEADAIEAELIERELARRDFALFCEFVYGWPAHAVPMHDEWQAHLKACWAQNKGAGIMAPRYHGKTQQLARALPVFELGRSTEPDLAWCPNIRVNLFQHVDDKAEETLGQIKVDIESNERLHQLFPRLEPDYKRGWKQNAIYVRRTENVREPSMAAHGILSSLTSGRSDLTIGDDWCSLKTSLQEPASRKRVVQAYMSDVVNLGLEGHTRIVNIGTAWSEADLNAMLQNDPELSQDWDWLIYRIQAEPGDPMQVLWPGVWEVEQLEARRRKITEREFERGFNNRPYAEGETTFSWEAIKSCFDDTVAPGELGDRARLKAAGYDLAMSQKDDGSYFVAFMLGSLHDKRLTPLEIVRAQTSAPKQMDTAIRYQERWSPAVHRVENNAYQGALVDFLREKAVRGMKVEGFTTGKQKMDPMVGVPGMAASFENGGWLIPTKGGHDGSNLRCQCPQCVWLRELKGFPAGRIDTVMACWFAFDYLRGHGHIGDAKPSTGGERAFRRERMPRT